MIIKHFESDSIIVYKDIVRNQYFMHLFEIFYHLTIKAAVIEIIIKSLITAEIETINRESTDFELNFIKFNEFTEFKSENICINRDDDNNNKETESKRVK